MRTDPKDYDRLGGLAEQTVNGKTLRDTAPAPARSFGSFGEHVETREPLPTQVVNGERHTIGKGRIRDHVGERPNDKDTGGRPLRKS
jgi:hypothetical protein